MRRAASLIKRLRTPVSGEIAGEFANDPETVDVLYAAVELLDRARESSSDENLGDIGRAYEFVSTVGWDDDFGERDWMLARLAFLAWDQCRLAEDYPATLTWRRRCSDHTLAQELVRNFFAIPVRDRSLELSDRYFADECVLLTACERLDNDRIKFPASVELEGAALYEWMDSRANEAGLDHELVHFLAATVALATLGAKLGIQHRDNVPMWFARIGSHLGACRGSGPLAAILEHRRITKLYLENDYSTALSCIDALASRFEALGMVANAHLVRFLKGLLLKDCGESEGALRAFNDLQGPACEGWLASLALSSSAEVLGRQGRFAQALGLANEAFRLAQESGSLSCLALAQGTVGELLRDHGDVKASIAAYAASAVSYETAGMSALAAYSRVVIAETLLLAGRTREAACEVLAALPTIESRWLTQEAVAAIAILREAIQRQQADPDALRQLREQLQLMRREGKL